MNARNFMVSVPPEVFDEAETLYAPSDDPVLQLVLPVFEAIVQTAFMKIGSPEVVMETFWRAYVTLLAEVRKAVLEVEEELMKALEKEEAVFGMEMELMPQRRYSSGLDDFPANPMDTNVGASLDEEEVYLTDFPDNEEEEVDLFLDFVYVGEESSDEEGRTPGQDYEEHVDPLPM
ncbi:hypothetical protein PM082_019840 [Marasmius tenuissimus]|nr:hypothetical protein PM082_019840 [Marasmius tenuissimus]